MFGLCFVMGYLVPFLIMLLLVYACLSTFVQFVLSLKRGYALLA